jgi:hypothetical protein
LTNAFAFTYDLRFFLESIEVQLRGQHMEEGCKVDYANVAVGTSRGGEDRKEKLCKVKVA